MQPKVDYESGAFDLFRHRLEQIIDMKHPLAMLAGKIDWEWLYEKCKIHYSADGRPGNSIRLMLGLLILKHMENLPALP